jgi:hypothetical protein
MIRSHYHRRALFYTRLGRESSQTRIVLYYVSMQGVTMTEAFCIYAVICTYYRHVFKRLWFAVITDRVMRDAWNPHL